MKHLIIVICLGILCPNLVIAQGLNTPQKKNIVDSLIHGKSKNEEDDNNKLHFINNGGISKGVAENLGINNTVEVARYRIDINPKRSSLILIISTSSTFDPNIDMNDSQPILERIASEIINPVGGIYRIQLGNPNQKGTAFKKLDHWWSWNLGYGAIPIRQSDFRSDEELNGTLVKKLNFNLTGGFLFPLPIKKINNRSSMAKTSSTKVENEKGAEKLYLFGNTLMGFSSILEKRDHLYFELFQDDYGNKAHNNALTYNLELGFSYKDWIIVFGHMGRRSFGKGAQDATIFGLEPRSYVSFKSDF